MRLILVRHGESEFNVRGGPEGTDDSPLTARGRDQARAVAAHFANTPIDAIYSSTLARAAETARFIAEPHAIPVIADGRIVETDFGKGASYRGHRGTKAIVAAASDARSDPYTYAEHGGETIAAVIARARPFFKELVRDHRGKTVLVVAHGSLIRLVVHDLLDLSRSDVLAVESHHNTAYTILDLAEDGSWNAHVIAAKDHL